MKRFFIKSVTSYPLLGKKLLHLRRCLLLVLGVTAVGMMVQSGMVTPADAIALPLDGLTVALDPGHGGYDGGARAHDSGIWEKELTLKIAMAASEELQKQGAKVYLTRRDDVCLAEGPAAGKARKRADLQERISIADAVGADVLLSIHLNEYRDRAQSGPQVFYQQGGDEGRLLSGALQQALIDELKPKKQRKAMAGDYYVLRGKLPSALVECGFLSNPEEEKLLLDVDYHHRIGKALAKGLQNWLELKARLAENACAAEGSML